MNIQRKMGSPAVCLLQTNHFPFQPFQIQLIIHSSSYFKTHIMATTISLSKEECMGNKYKLSKADFSYYGEVK